MKAAPSGLALAAAWMAAVLSASAQPKKTAPPVRAESASTFQSTTAADGEQTVEIHNVTYEVSGDTVPGRPQGQRLLLRNTVRSRQVIGDIGEEATVTLEAWPLGQDPKQKPLYALTVPGTEGHTRDNALFVIARGLEDTEWWSVYKLGSGESLFDTYVPLLAFSIARDLLTLRYVGLEIPEDDSKDARLTQPTVVALIRYASADRVIREALLTCDDAPKAALLRSFADTTRELSLVEDAAQTAQSLKLLFTQDYPSPPNPVEVRIPVRNDDLDLAHAQLPPRLHLSAWKR